jgi:hypothetical protein
MTSTNAIVYNIRLFFVFALELPPAGAFARADGHSYGKPLSRVLPGSIIGGSCDADGHIVDHAGYTVDVGHELGDQALLGSVFGDAG